MRFLKYLIVLSVALPMANLLAQESTYSDKPAELTEGSTLFSQHCASCHMLANDAIGPPLGGITTIVEKQKLLDYIRNPAEQIEEGDVRAKALLERYKVLMPPFAHLDSGQIESILSFVHHQSIEKDLTPFEIPVGESATGRGRLVDPVKVSNLVIELEDFAEIPRLPNRPAYKGIAFMRPDPRAEAAYFVSELMGILYRLEKGDLGVFLDMREHFELFVYEPGVATGLGSFALHPEFSTNGIFYTTHAEIRHGSPAINADDIPPDAPKGVSPPLEWTLTEWTMSDVTATTFKGSRREILRFVTPTTAHGSQEIDFSPVSDRDDPDYGKLYISCGDGGSINIKRPDMTGHPRAILGAIMRIDPMGANGATGQYGIPADNPFAQSEDPLVHKEIWAYGFRNPHRMSWDLEHGRRMIAVDIGEANIEEVNLIEPGGSYGWGVGGLEGMGRIDPLMDPKVVFAASEEELSGFVLPHGQYDHQDGQAITGGFVYRGPLEKLRGKYIFGDIVNGRVFYMEMDASLEERAIYGIHIKRNGVLTSIRELSKVDRAHLRFAYDERKGDLFILTKDDGMIRRVSKAYLANP